MRRILSVILLVLGGWFLSSEVMMAWIDFGQGFGARLGIVGIMALFSTPFLLLGMWASPGKRFTDIGLTLMIAAAVGAGLGLTMLMVCNDPGFVQMMPPGQTVPKFSIAPVSGLLNLAVVGGGGFLLWRFGRARLRRKEPDLERIFGDE